MRSTTVCTFLFFILQYCSNNLTENEKLPLLGALAVMSAPDKECAVLENYTKLEKGKPVTADSSKDRRFYLFPEAKVITTRLKYLNSGCRFQKVTENYNGSIVTKYYPVIGNSFVSRYCRDNKAYGLEDIDKDSLLKPSSSGNVSSDFPNGDTDITRTFLNGNIYFWLVGYIWNSPLEETCLYEVYYE